MLQYLVLCEHSKGDGLMVPPVAGTRDAQHARERNELALSRGKATGRSWSNLSCIERDDYVEFE